MSGLWRPFPKVNETALVKACLEVLKLKGVVCWRQNTGGMQKTYKGKTSHVRFGQRGTSDILGILPGGRFLAVECKVGKGVLTEHQREFLATVNRAGGWGVVVRSESELLEWLKDAVK